MKKTRGGLGGARIIRDENVTRKSLSDRHVGPIGDKYKPALASKKMQASKINCHQQRHSSSETHQHLD